MSHPAPALLASNRHGWADVVDELVRSCTARAPEGGLWERPGAAAVTAGAGQIAWVHGAVNATELLEVVDNASGLHEVFVADNQRAVIEALATNGWASAERLGQFVRDAVTPTGSPSLPAGVTLSELGPTDVPALRELLRTQGVDPRLLVSHYPDGFFAVAAPVRVIGAKTPSGHLVATAAVRRQSAGAMGFALNVHRDWRRLGLARAVLTESLRAAAEMGAGFVHAQASGAGAGCVAACGFTSAGTWQVMRRV